MSNSPWFGVLAIAAWSGGGLAIILLLGKAQTLRAGLTKRLRLPILVGVAILGLAASALVLRNGVGSELVLYVLLASGLFGLSDAPRPVWARILLWLDGALLCAVILWSWPHLRTFATDATADKVLTAFVVGALLYGAASSLYRLFRPQADLSTSTAETGTPA